MRLSKLNKLYKSFIVSITMLILLPLMIKDAGAAQAAVWTHCSTGDGLAYQSSYQRMAGFWDGQKWLAGDFNGDGMDDLVNVYNSSGRAMVWTHFSNGDGFEYRSSYQRMAGFWDGQKWLAGDFNGDGMDDLVNIYDSGGRAAIWTHFSNGDGFEYQSNYRRFEDFWDGQKWLAGDFNGDDRDDLVNLYNSGGRIAMWTHFAKSSGFEYQSSYQRVPVVWDNSRKWLAGDINGDGMDDLVNIYNSSGKAAVWGLFSAGSGFEYYSSYRKMAGFWDGQKWLVGDFNGDLDFDLVNSYGSAS